MAGPVDVQRLLRRHDAMKAQRGPCENVWRRCFELTYPERAHGLNGNIIDAQDAQNKRARILDSTAPDAVRLWCSSVMSGTTPANAVWFQLDAGQESDEERRWLDDAAKVCWEAIHDGNYDAAKFECLMDMAGAGFFVLFIDEARDVDGNGIGLRFEQWPIGQCYIASSQAGGAVDIVHREFELTAEQAVNEYGEDMVSDRVRECAKEKPAEKFMFVQCIHPRKTAGGMLAKNLPVASIHVELASRKVVRESGYHEMPVVVPRWMLRPGSSYPTGPVSAALPDMETLNELKAMHLEQGALDIAPPYVAADDGVLNPRSLKIGPKRMIIANDVDSIKQLPTGGNWQLAETMVASLQSSIRKMLMADQLQPQDGPAMTATEVHVRVALIRQLLGPLFGRLQAEDLEPTIVRVFGLAYRAGALGEAPESLQDRVFSVRYQSPMARAQKLEDVTAAERLVMNMGVLAQSGQEQVLDLLDGDEAVRFMQESLGAPSRIIRSAQSVSELRAAKQQQAEQAQQQGMQQQLGMMAAEKAMERTQ